VPKKVQVFQEACKKQVFMFIALATRSPFIYRNNDYFVG